MFHPTWPCPVLASAAMGQAAQPAPLSQAIRAAVAAADGLQHGSAVVDLKRLDYFHPDWTQPARQMRFLHSLGDGARSNRTPHPAPSGCSR